MQGNLFTLSAPSGAGKTSLANKIIDTVDNIRMSVSYTTRSQRVGERDGVDYYFIDELTFKDMQQQQCFLESAQVFGNYYGTAKQSVEAILNEGMDVLLEIDWQGAQQVKQQLSNSYGIFIFPPSLESLKDRLNDRAKDSEPIIRLRLNEAEKELKNYANADFLIVNDDYDIAVAQLRTIIESIRLRVDYQTQKLQPLLENLNLF